MTCKLSLSESQELEEKKIEIVKGLICDILENENLDSLEFEVIFLEILTELKESELRDKIIIEHRKETGTEF